jgi:molecular chaperone GrpE (heat shock protein)/DNA-binding Xre family transcriptional regulator
MPQELLPDFTPQLQELMQRSGFSSYKALCQAAEMPEKQLRALRRGNLTHLRLDALQRLAQALQLSFAQLLNAFAPPSLDSLPTPTNNTIAPFPLPTAPSPDSSASVDFCQREAELLQQECDRLQTQLAQQKDQLWQEFQQTSLQTLESLILQLPTAAYAAQQNPQAPAVKLLPLLKPLDALLETWGIRAIAPVGTELPYNPQLHQLLDGSANPGDLVKVRYTGYVQDEKLQGEKLLYRAKVSPVK